jgi:hypothetical protein
MQHELDQLSVTVGRIEAKLDSIGGHLQEQHSVLRSHSSRLGALERSKAWLLGLTAGISALFSWLFR